MKLKSKIITLSVIAGIVILIVVYFLLTRMKYNEPDDMGNSAGNLYNGGLFCESGGYIYFANPYDDNALYRMKPDGSKVEHLIGDNVSYINVCGDYVYYKRHNYKSAVETVFRGNLYGLYRIKTTGGKTKELYRGIIGSVALTGNYLYFQSYEDDKTYNLRKIKIDKKDEKLVSEESYVPACVFSGSLYFAGVTENHNLLKLDTQKDVTSLFLEGNIYLPDFYDNHVYYIDCDNGRALTKKNLTTGESVVLSGNDTVVNYNMCGDKDVIFYQAENGASHKLVKTDLNGNSYQTVADGDCVNISITSKYTYYFKVFGDEKTLYRTPTTGIADPEIYVID